MYNYSVRRAWFSDPATYPIMAVWAFTGALIVGMGVNAFATYKDVKINPGHKHQTIRDWGEGHHTSVTEALGKVSPLLP